MVNDVLDAGKRCVCTLAWCAAVVCAPAAWAQGSVCKYIDADGNIVFSNLPPEKGQRRISCIGGDEPRKGSAPARSTTPTPAGFPKVDADTQRTRDDMRRKVLADELGAEEKLLAEARATYANGAPVPLPEEQGNAEKYRERIARLRQSMQLHERNIEALRKELGTTK
jgi:hypothetical protein